MSRGKHKLYATFIAPAAPSNLRKRNHFQPQRNEALTYRYYYYLMLASYRYEAILDALEREFFLSKAHIAKLLTQQEQHALLQEIIEKEVTLRELTRRYPQFVWRFQGAA